MASILMFASHGSSCGNCGKVMGVQGKTLDIVAELRFELHRLRHYEPRRRWTCKPSTAELERQRERTRIIRNTWRVS